jgi:hypothetical protein
MDGSGFSGAARVAVLVDGDNVSVRHRGAVMAEATRLGRVDVRRVYGDASKFGEWDGFRVMHAGGAKNAADMFLVVDAMALALSEGMGAFVIASSDRDFAPVALALRERGVMVVGAGRANAGLTFQQACSRFVVLEETVPEVEVKPPPVSTAAKPVAPALKTVPLSVGYVRAARAIHEAGGEMTLQALGHALGKRPEGVTSWRAFLRSRDDVFGMTGDGMEIRIRVLKGAAKVG